MAETGSYVLVAVAIWLGWQVVREMAVGRLPAELSLRLSPGSALVLGRAAETEFAADRFENAEYLARQSLVRAPFNVQALRVLGLATAESGRKTEADDILTLAGNWSLRDDPSHAWLLDYRLTRGDYRSSFAHADTLARRRDDLQPQLFQLFTVAASTDRRSLPVLASLLAAAPPWRTAYLTGLYRTKTGLELAANLAIALQTTRQPFSNLELETLYGHLFAKGMLPTMSEVRKRLGRPAPAARLMNGDFDAPEGPAPFEWKLFNAGGAVAEILPDDIREDSALRAQFGSFSSRPLTEQLIQLTPGNYRLSGQTRTEVGSPYDRLVWGVSCFETGATIGDSKDATIAGETDWKAFAFDFRVPEHGCTAQWIRLIPRPGDRRDAVVAWYDRLVVTRLQ
tara:strand:- start:193 stop:1383 length:1191 start_codon:yes stop_codon:yes gene_type:complete